MNKNKLSEDPYAHIIINNIKLDWIDKNIYQLSIFSSVCQQSSSSFHTQHVGLKGIFSCCFFMRKPWPELRIRAPCSRVVPGDNLFKNNWLSVQVFASFSKHINAG